MLSPALYSSVGRFNENQVSIENLINVNLLKEHDGVLCRSTHWELVRNICVWIKPAAYFN